MDTYILKQSFSGIANLDLASEILFKLHFTQ